MAFSMSVITDFVAYGDTGRKAGELLSTVRVDALSRALREFHVSVLFNRRTNKRWDKHKSELSLSLP